MPCPQTIGDAVQPASGTDQLERPRAQRNHPTQRQQAQSTHRHQGDVPQQLITRDPRRQNTPIATRMQRPPQRWRLSGLRSHHKVESLPNGMRGGVALAKISQYDGTILRVSHGK